MHKIAYNYDSLEMAIREIKYKDVDVGDLIVDAPRSNRSARQLLILSREDDGSETEFRFVNLDTMKISFTRWMEPDGTFVFIDEDGLHIKIEK